METPFYANFSAYVFYANTLNTHKWWV